MERRDIQSKIPSFTIPDLMEIGRSELVSISHYNGKLIARCGSRMETFRFPCRIDAIIISICTEGECTLLSNLREYTLTKGAMFISGPNSTLQVQSSANFRSDVLVVAPSLLGESHINLPSMMPLFLELDDRSCIPSPEIERGAMHNLIAMIASEIEIKPETSFTSEILGGLVTAAIAKMCDIITRYLEQHPKTANQRSDRAEEYFKQFMDLLGQHYKRERTVAFYSQQICITPKYLSTAIKRYSNKSISEWIDNYVILEAKMLLKYSNMSIQEIAYYLNFTNQSFFGSYFKRNTGLSPSQYKSQ